MLLTVFWRSSELKISNAENFSSWIFNKIDSNKNYKIDLSLKIVDSSNIKF